MALTDGLVSFWELEEASGTRVDSHGANDLTDNNTVGQVAGKVGNAALCVRANTEFLNILDNVGLSTGDIDFTILTWVNLTSKPADIMSVVSKWLGTGNQREYDIRWINTTDRFAFLVSSNGTATATVSANNFGVPSLATWYFIVAAHDSVGDTISISVNDGVADSAAHSAGVFDSTAEFRIGTVGGNAERLDGAADQVGLWKRVLTAEEKTWLYNAGDGRSYAEVLAGIADVRRKIIPAYARVE